MKKTKVAVLGKFDGLNKGQLEFLSHAKELGDELYAVAISNNKFKEKDLSSKRINSEYIYLDIYNKRIHHRSKK